MRLQKQKHTVEKLAAFAVVKPAYMAGYYKEEKIKISWEHTSSALRSMVGGQQTPSTNRSFISLMASQYVSDPVIKRREPKETLAHVIEVATLFNPSP